MEDFFFFCDLSMITLSPWARFPCTVEMSLNREEKKKKNPWMAAVVVLEKLAMGFFCSTALG